MSEAHLTVRYVSWCLTFVAVVGIAAYTFMFAWKLDNLPVEGAARVSGQTPQFPQQLPNITVQTTVLPRVQAVPLNVSVTVGGKCVRINDTYRCFE